MLIWILVQHLKVLSDSHLRLIVFSEFIVELIQENLILYSHQSEKIKTNYSSHDIFSLGFNFNYSRVSFEVTVLYHFLLKVGGLLTLIASLAGYQPPILNPGMAAWMIKYWRHLKKEKVE